jgi:hypothetical protein
LFSPADDDIVVAAVPEVSRFYGIVIAMFFREHARPHFHARYGDFKMTVEIESGLVTGTFPVRERRLVLEWLQLHRAELFMNWNRARRHEPIESIAPLE